MLDNMLIKKLIKKYGGYKHIKYLVNSFSDFHEVIRTVNMIVGKAHDLEEMEYLTKMAAFSATPLPNTISKFLCCFNIPHKLFGDAFKRNIISLDFSRFPLQQESYKFSTSGRMSCFAYSVATLFDINLAIQHFDAELHGKVSGFESFKIRRSAAIAVQLPENKNSMYQIKLLVKDWPGAKTIKR